MMFKAVAIVLLAAGVLVQFDQVLYNGRHVDGGVNLAREIKRGFGF